MARRNQPIMIWGNGEEYTIAVETLPSGWDIHRVGYDSLGAHFLETLTAFNPPKSWGERIPQSALPPDIRRWAKAIYRDNFDSGLSASESRSAPGNEEAARELVLYVTNDSDLYHRQAILIMDNLARKMRRGQYDHDLAVKAWAWLANAGAKKYAKEFATASEWAAIFSPATRLMAAQELRDHYDEDVRERAAGGK